MKVISLDQASLIYECASETKIVRHRVHAPSLSRFSGALRSLRLLLADDSQNEYWRPVMWRAFWYRKLASCAPLPPCHPELRGKQLLGEVQELLDTCEEVAPPVASCAREMVSTFGAAVEERGNPLLDEIVYLLDFEVAKGVGVLVADSRLMQATQDLLDRAPVLEGAEAIHASELRSGTTYDRLFLVGAAEWYSTGALSAPRAKRLDVVRYSFVRDGWRPERTFLGNSVLGRSLPVMDLGEVDGPDSNQLDDVVLPPTNVQQIVDKIAGDIESGSHDIALAKLVLLEGDAAVFLEADRDSKAFVIDLEAEGADPVLRLSVASLERGMFLLLRTEGGGDYVVPVADRFLGPLAGEARSSLQLWKGILRDRVSLYGPSRVAEELERRGGSGVDADDVRRWMSPTTIGTASEENFRAIMRYTSLELRHSQMWRLMRRIRADHKRAGLKIRQLLLEQVEKVDPHDLLKQGVKEFELPEHDAGSLTAFRIHEILGGDHLIPPSRLGRPFHRGDASWLA